MKKSRLALSSLAALVLLAVAIQWVPVTRSNPPVETEIAAPPEVQAILKVSCYDCHSNATVWPWYSKVAPVSWLVASDVAEGRSKFNFSSWNRLSAAERSMIITRAGKEVSKGDMPPWYYTIKHADARMTPAKRAVIAAWAAQPPSL